MKGGRYEDLTSPRRRRHAEHGPEVAPPQPRREPLSPGKQRIAEALAALLVAHYRRQHETSGPATERIPVA